MVFRRGNPLHGLAVRLLFFVVLAVGGVLAIHAWFSYRSSREVLLGMLERRAANTSDLIARATHDGMLLNRLGEVQETFERLASGGEIAEIRVYDKRGNVVLSAQDSQIGERLTIGSETCASCHGPRPALAEALLSMDAMARDAEGGEVLRHLRVIANEPGCEGANCHGSVERQPILGVLDVELSMASAQALLDRERSRVIGSSLLLMLLLGVGSALYIHRVVHRPVVALIEGTRRIAEGKLDAVIEVGGGHELAELAHSFNRMASNLAEAEEELKSWSQNMEQQVVEKTRELQQANAQVLHMDRMASLGKMAATVAHELNNPLTGMLNYTRLTQRELEESQVEPERRALCQQYLRSLQDECVRCGHIVTDLLLFARTRGAEMRRVDAREILDRALMLVEHQMRIGAVELETRIRARDSGLVADGAQLEQVLLALLINAIEAMSDSGAQERGLRVDMDDVDDELVIAVEDSGIGIDADSLPHIFEPFFSTKDEQSGVGLGLAVSYGIVRRHGGRIEVRSQPGTGSRFEVHLPRDCTQTRHKGEAGVASAPLGGDMS